MENIYYVYIWIREDYNTVFYIGKGKNDKYHNRAKSIKNNQYFKNIYYKVPTHYEIVYQNLSEKEALEQEKKLIREYIDNKGYSIQANKSIPKVQGRHLVNLTYGGEGISGYRHTKESIEKSTRRGEQNGNYGKRGSAHQCYGISKTEEHKNKIRSSNPRSTKVYCVEFNEYYDSARQASKSILQKYNIVTYHSGITNCCKGKRTSCGFYKDTKEKANLHFIYSPTTTERVDVDRLTG